MSVVPLEFSYKFLVSFDGLDVREEGAVVRVTWPLLSATLVHRVDDEVRRSHTVVGKDAGEREVRTVSEVDLERRNPELALFGTRGFLLGNYAEFNVFESWWGEEPQHRAWTMLGSCQASIGMATPLMRHVFGEVVESDSNLRWAHTVRLLGVTRDNVERRLLQALLTFSARLGADLSVAELDAAEPDWPEALDRPAAEIPCVPFLVNDLEALRLLWAGASASDWQLAFMQYYRVLEFYSVLQHADEIGRLRWDRAISEVEFVRSTLAIIARDERLHLVRLIAQCASEETVQSACDLGLIDRTDRAMLASRLYDFRNAVFHAKYEARTMLYTESILAPSETGEHWRKVAKALALDAMRSAGTPDR